MYDMYVNVVSPLLELTVLIVDDFMFLWPSDRQLLFGSNWLELFVWRDDDDDSDSDCDYGDDSDGDDDDDGDTDTDDDDDDTGDYFDCTDGAAGGSAERKRGGGEGGRSESQRDGDAHEEVHPSQ